MLDLVKRFLSDIPHYIVGNFIVTRVHDPLCNRSKKNNDRHLAQDHKNPCKIHQTFCNDKIHCLTCQDRNIKCQCHGHCRKENGAAQICPISFDITQYLSYRCFLLFCHYLFHACSPPAAFLNWE